MHNFNVITIFLIPKIHDAHYLDKFKSIAMSNFKFKVITKILPDRLANFIPLLISKKQKGFIRGRNIMDFNLLDRKFFGGNLDVKVDVNKAFESID